MSQEGFGIFLKSIQNQPGFSERSLIWQESLQNLSTPLQVSTKILKSNTGLPSRADCKGIQHIYRCVVLSLPFILLFLWNLKLKLDMWIFPCMTGRLKQTEYDCSLHLSLHISNVCLDNKSQTLIFLFRKKMSIDFSRISHTMDWNDQNLRVGQCRVK